MTEPSVVLVVEDEESTRKLTARRLRKSGLEVIEAATLDEGQAAVDSCRLDLVLLDLGLGDDDHDGRNGRRLFDHLQAVAPEVPVIVLTSDGTATSAVDLMRQGALHYAVKPIGEDVLLHLSRLGVAVSAGRRELGVLREVRGRSQGPTWHIGRTAAMQNAAHALARFAPTKAPIILEGESGTGKELAARHVHDLSGRTGEFVAINCAALPKDLLESQLFGHEKGAFTNAFERQRGLLELADHGTLMLDEITCMHPDTQPKLLRVVQGFKVRRLGGQKEIQLDVRVISASHRSLADAVAAGEFRADLYYRLAVATVELPPLRQRGPDIPYFAETFLEEVAQTILDAPTRLTQRAIMALVDYHWPGNTRELRNVIEGAAIMARGEEAVDVVHLSPGVRGLAPLPADAAPGGPPARLPAEGIDLKRVREDWERAMVSQALERTHGNQSAAARLLGLTRDELRYRVEKFTPDGAVEGE